MGQTEWQGEAEEQRHGWERLGRKGKRQQRLKCIREEESNGNMGKGRYIQKKERARD